MRKLAIVIALSLAPVLLAQNGLIATVAGDGTPGTSGVGGPAINASLTSPMGVCTDSAGNFYIADGSNNRVLKVNGATGILTLVAGTGAASSTGDHGPAVQATLNRPAAVAVDSTGNLFIAENGGNRVRRVDAASQIITTVAGTGTAGFSGDGGLAVSEQLNIPYGVTLDAFGNLYIADTGNYRIRRVDAITGILTTVAGNGINAHSPDGTPAVSASLAVPAGVSVDQQGNLFISEALASTVREVSAATGLLSTVAGNGGANFNGDGIPATSAALGFVFGSVVWDSAGNLYIADGTGRIRRVDTNGMITTVAGSGAGAHAIVESGIGGGGGTTSCPSGLGDNGPAAIATIDGASGLAFDTHGNLLISDYLDCRVRSVSLPSALLYTNTTLTQNGQSLTATVTPIGGSGTPTGTVLLTTEYTGDTGQGTPLALATLSGGTATINLSQLPSGSGPYSVMAIYQGDGTYNGSGSASINASGAGNGNAAALVATYSYPPLVSFPVSISIAANGNHGQPTGTVQISEGGNVLSTVSLVNGAAYYTYTSSTPGAHQISLLYSGDSVYLAQNQNFTLTLLVPGTVTVTADNNPVTAGANVTFTATLAPSTATGSVTFFADGGSLGTQSLVNSRASVTSSTTVVGTHVITASYGGDSAVSAATSQPYSETVVTPTSVALTASASPSTWNQAVTLTATISPATAAGPINFYDGITLLGSTTSNSGTASLTTASLAAGSHSLTAAYGALGIYGGSTSPTVAQTVNKATPVVTLSSSANPAMNSGTLTFTASVNPADTGATVQFLDGQTVLGTSTVSGGRATFSSSSSAPGTHTITAVSQSDSNLNQATSPALTQTIQSPTAISLTTPSGTTVFGQAVTFTAALTPAAATGTVQFSDSGTAVGTAALVNGTGSLMLPSLSAGTHSLQAAYNGDGIYLPIASAAWVQTVSKAPTSAALATSLNPSTAGAAVTFSATIAPAAATGTVQFLDGGTVIGTATLTNGAGSLSISSLAAGGHTVTAVYSGDSSYLGATSAAISQTVMAVSSTTVSASSANISYGQNVQITASIAPASSTGTVQFLDGATVLATLPLTAGGATVTVTNPIAGTHSFTAVYSGDANDTASTSPATVVTVNKAANTVAVTSSSNPAASGQSVVFTASVTPATATGTVQFLDGATAIGTATLSGGTAAFSVGSLAPGTHSITAIYAGDSNDSGATSGVLSQTVSKLPTSTALSASSGSITSGQSVQLTATVAPASATGTVQFLDGATVLATVTLTGGSASVTATNLTAGTHSMTALYSGDTNNAGSSSAATTVSVAKAASSAVIATSLNPSVAGQSVTFTATIAPASATGSVQFLDGATVIGTATLSGGLAALSTAALAAGSHSITAVYSGDGNYAGATSGAISQTVKATTTTVLSASTTTAVAGQTVTFTATVSPSAATGSVQFLDGATVIGTATLSGGSATLSTSTLTVGSHSVTASYGGAAGYTTSASSAVNVTVAAAPPSAPSNLAATAASSSQINLTWTASASSGVTYNVYASTTSGFAPSSGNRIASGIATTSYSHSGLAASTAWYYRVTAQNANGESAGSNQANATTQAAGASCHVVYTITTQWNVGFGTALTIQNTGTAPINGWHLTWTWAGNQQITQSWNANYTQSGANATLTNASWNPTIAAGATISGIGFNGSYSGSNPTPTAFYLNGTLCH